MSSEAYIKKQYARVGITLGSSINGRWKILCPFPGHLDSNPSFAVFSDGGYHCYGCRMHGALEDILAYFGVENTVNIANIDVTCIVDSYKEFFAKLTKSLEVRIKNYLRNKPDKVKYKVYDKLDRMVLEMESVKANNRLVLAVLAKKRLEQIVNNLGGKK